MRGAGPEPFGLVAIESLACGTPILARRVGGLPGIIRDGVDGFFGDDVAALAFQGQRIGSLDRRAIREPGVGEVSAPPEADPIKELYSRVPRGPPPMRAPD